MLRRGVRQGGGGGFALALGCMLLALTVRALVPDGYRLETRSGQFEVVICTADAEVRTILVDADGRAVTPGEHPDGSETDLSKAACPFLGQVAFAPPPVVLDAGIVSRWTLPVQLAASSVNPGGRNTRGPPPPVRGPPARLI